MERQQEYKEAEQFPKESRSSVPGRICLAGESLDWMLNGSSIVGAIDLRTHVVIRELPVNTNSVAIRSEELEKRGKVVSNSELSSYGDENINHFQAALKVFSSTGMELSPISIEAKSHLPIRAGVSSSAALILATLASLQQYYGTNFTRQELCFLAHQAENSELETGSGFMDFYACALGGVRYLNCSTGPPYTEEGGDFTGIKIVLVDTLVPHETKKFISSKRQRYIEGEPHIVKYADLTEKVVEEIKLLLTQFADNVETIGEYVYKCHTYLRDYMHCSTELLDQCVEVCMQNGACGAKLTGTGMGGCMFALTTEDSTPAILHKLLALPAKARVVNFSEEGLWLESEHLSP